MNTRSLTIAAIVLLACTSTWAQAPLGAAIFGPEEPATDLTVFFSFSCATCRDMWEDIQKLVTDYDDRARFLLRPIASPGNTGSLQAGAAALHAHHRGQFWDMASGLFALPTLNQQSILQAGAAAGLEPDGLTQALSDPPLMEAVAGNKQAFDQSGYYLTPTILIDGQPYEGRHSYAELEYALKAALGHDLTALETPASAEPRWSQLIYPAPHEAPQIAQPTVSPGDKAPDFALPSVSGETIRLADYQGKKNVLLTFVPGAFTPVCSGQWPKYADQKAELDQLDTIVLGITADNIPSLYAWTKGMPGLNFAVLSDFWPHGETAEKYGILREDTGKTERATFLIDKQGIVRYVKVHDFNAMPDIHETMEALKKFQR